MEPWHPDGNPDQALRAWASPLLSIANCPAQRIVDNHATTMKLRQEGIDGLTVEFAKEAGPYHLHGFTAFVVAGPPEFSVETHPHLACLKKHLPGAYTEQWTNEKEDVRQLLAKAQEHIDELKSDFEELRRLILDKTNPKYVSQLALLSRDNWMEIETQFINPLSMCDEFLTTCGFVKGLVKGTGISLEDLGLLWISVGATAEDGCLSNKADYLPTLTRILDQYAVPATAECLPHRSSLLQSAAEAGLVDVCRLLIGRLQEEEGNPMKDEAGDAGAFFFGGGGGGAAGGEEAPTTLTSVLGQRNRFGDTILIGCIRECVPNVVSLLLSNDFATTAQVQSFINLTNETGQNCLSMCAIVASGYHSDETKELLGFEMFKLCVDAGVDLNLRNPNNGDTAFLKLCRYHDAGKSRGESCRATEMCLRYLLEESPRREEVDFTLKPNPNPQNAPASTTVAEVILSNPNAEARRLVLNAAAQREDRCLGSGDPANVLQLSKSKKAAAGGASRFGGGFGMMGRHLPRSDPPPAGTSLVRGARATLKGLVGRADLNGRVATLVRFKSLEGGGGGGSSGRWACKLLTAPTAGEEEVGAAAGAGGGDLGMVNVKAANLEPCVEEELANSGLGRVTAFGHHLPSAARVLRHKHGAEIADPGALVPPAFFGYSCGDTCGGGARAGKGAGKKARCACVQNSRPCLGECPTGCSQKNPRNDVVLKDGTALFTDGSGGGAAACAMAHLPIVEALTEEQLSARYGLACAERWGDSMGGEHEVEEDGEEDSEGGGVKKKKGTVSLRQLLAGGGYGDYFEGCTSCGGDGAQSFCFCLNRAVNSNCVNHCSACGKCFYTRHGAMRCPHCKALDPGTAEFFGREGESKWAWEIPDEMEAGLAREGYWGF